MNTENKELKEFISESIVLLEKQKRDVGLDSERLKLLNQLGDLVENLCLSGVIHSPDEMKPVLAEIEHINSLGKSKWHEVIYFDKHWRSYFGSKTFKDGEKVIKWKYCKDCL